MFRDGRCQYVHRFIYEECFGLIPEGMVVRHKCNNVKCMNPEHLMIGTTAENICDKKLFGTWGSGENSAKHKLTWEVVGHIRQDSAALSQKELSEKYKLDFRQVWKIVRFKSWIVNGFGQRVVGAQES